MPSSREIENLVDIVSLISYTGVVLERTGDIFSGLCPLHKDKETQSLKVYPGSNSWCCFGTGCGDKASKLNGGGAISWVKQKYSLRFEDAVTWLSENYLHIPKIVLPTIRVAEKKEATPLLDITPIVYWHGMLDLCDRRKWFHGRGFTDKTIDTELFGWNGERYVIPVWEGEPGKSLCLGVRLRRSSSEGPKYVGLEGHNQPTVWGRWHCKGKKLILAFAGELDAARAVQDGFFAFSVVNGIKSIARFPDNWPNMWFPDSLYVVVAFDKNEEIDGAFLARAWNNIKGSMTGRVFHWPPNVSAKDYCEFRDIGNTHEDFLKLMNDQINAHRLC